MSRSEDGLPWWVWLLIGLMALWAAVWYVGFSLPSHYRQGRTSAMLRPSAPSLVFPWRWSETLLDAPESPC